MDIHRGGAFYVAARGKCEERDERWELASRAANEGIWDWDMHTNKVYRSDCWFEMFGYQPGELSDNPWGMGRHDSSRRCGLA